MNAVHDVEETKSVFLVFKANLTTFLATRYN